MISKSYKVIMRIILTGGGTAGHITPNIALIEKLKEIGFEISYIGTKDGMEYNLITKENIKFNSIKAGKLRRYFDIKTITDVFKVMQGFFQSIFIINKIKPDVIFSKGGFVSCPVIWAGWLLRVPIVIHESDFSPGLANKLSLPFAKKICLTFPETKEYVNRKKAKITGLPVRSSILNGNKKEALKICGFTIEKPVVLIIGGSQGAGIINNIVRENLDNILKKYQVCHICGKGSLKEELIGLKGYKQFEYVSEELAHLFKVSDFIISRAGATSIFEILALNKPNILIPLSKKASRGDQLLNAKSFSKSGFSCVIYEEDLTGDILIKKMDEVYKNREKYIENMKNFSKKNSVDEVVNVITNSFL